jgi:hypothetical protein
MKKNKDIISKVKESEVQYESISHATDSPAITFHSHQKENEESLQYQANLSPEDRMRHLYKLICISFGLGSEELRNPKLNNIIIIENSDEHFS